MQLFSYSFVIICKNKNFERNYYLLFHISLNFQLLKNSYLCVVIKLKLSPRKLLRTTHFLYVFLFLIIPFAASSQETGVLRGNISDPKGNRLNFVSVSITNIPKPIGTRTDKKGNYQIQIPANEELTVVVSYMGYESQSFIISVLPNETKQLDCMLQLSVKELPTHEKVEIRDKETGSVSINLEKIENITGPKGGIENILPGTSSSNELSSQYSVRGGNFDENLVYINGIEIYRPFLIRSGQQEGLSIINPDMVSNVRFSSGGFEAKYGDKMSSVLDINYKKPQQFKGSVSGSLLGTSLSIEDIVKEKFSYSFGFRQHSNNNLLKSLDQKGEYKTSFTDIQGLFDYQYNSKLRFSFLGIYSNNIYRVVPTDRETDFGNMYEPLRLKIYFDGEEKDRFQTLLGAFSSIYNPNENTQLQFIVSGFNSRESETYDILGEYWMSEIQADGEAGDIKGIGSYLDHGRNFLYANVFNIEHKGLIIAPSGNWNWGVKFQSEYIYSKLNEWELIDSAGYTIPSFEDFPGSANPHSNPPMLQNVINSKNEIQSNRLSGFIQKNWTFQTKQEDTFTLLTGIRTQYWNFNKEILVSPRVSVSYQPHGKDDIFFRLSTGVYSQSPFYREYRTPEGDINKNIKSQKSYQVVGAVDYQFTAWERPFKFVAEIYYKYITDLIPYTIDNLRISYAGHNNATGYATGLDLRLNGEFVPDIESWASITLMQTQENINGNGYTARPTDQRFMFKLFFQDYIPSVPWWKMNILFTFGSGLPFTQPNQTDFSKTGRLPAYMRADWGTSLRFKDPSSKWAKNNVFRHIKNAWIYFEVFNLFDNKNVISYIWVSDYENRQYAVPNYLTRRQLNIKLSLDF